MVFFLICWQKITGINPEKIRNLKAEDDDAGPNGLVEYRVVPGDGSDRQTKPNRSPLNILIEDFNRNKMWDREVVFGGVGKTKTPSSPPPSKAGYHSFSSTVGLLFCFFRLA
jgi:hypothetical protein